MFSFLPPPLPLDQIGGHTFTILLDCAEHVLHARLTVRGKQSQRIDDNLVAIGKKLTFFKNNTLPIMKTFEDGGKLVLVGGEREGGEREREGGGAEKQREREREGGRRDRERKGGELMHVSGKR